MSTYVTPLSDQFHAAVTDHMRSTGTDFSNAWASCKILHQNLWQRWQAQAKAANEAGIAPQKDNAQRRAEALAEFTRRVNERMQAAGESYGAAWAFVSQTQPRLAARMHNDFASDHQLAEAGQSLPPGMD